MCGFPWALAKPGTSPSTEDQGSLHPWHGLRLGGYAWALASPGSIRVDLDSVDFHGIHGTAKTLMWISMGIPKPGTTALMQTGTLAYTVAGIVWISWPYKGRLG